MGLETLLIPERRVEAGGEVFTLTPFRFRHMLKALPLFGGLMAFVKAEEKDGRLALKMDVDVLLTQGGDYLVPLMVMATGKDVAWVDTLGFDEGVALAAAVLELNADFFVRTRARGSAVPSAPSAGATSSES